MPIVKGTIHPDDGAVIGVMVGVSQNRRKVLERNHLPVPPPITVFAQIDTGSVVTGFQPAVFRDLEIQAFGRIPLRTPSTKPGEPWESDLYDVSVTLVSGNTTEYLPSIHSIVSEDFDREGVQAIIGRDVLSRCAFFYHGPEGWFHLAF